jgi:hypothetical protein
MYPRRRGLSTYLKGTTRSKFFSNCEKSAKGNKELVPSQHLASYLMNTMFMSPKDRHRDRM